MLKRSYRSYLIFNNWFRWGWWMHLDGSAGLNNSASPKWECVLAAVSQRGRVRVRWGWDAAWWSHAVGDAALRQVSHHHFCGLLTGTETRSDHLPLQPPSTALRLLCHRQGVPLLSTFLHFSSPFLLSAHCTPVLSFNQSLRNLMRFKCGARKVKKQTNNYNSCSLLLKNLP